MREQQKGEKTYNTCKEKAISHNNESVNHETHGCYHQKCMKSQQTSKKFEKQGIVIGRVSSLPLHKKGATNLKLMKGSVLLGSSWVGIVLMCREIWDLFMDVYLGSLPARQQPHLAWSHGRLYPVHSCLHPHPQSAGLQNVASSFGDPPSKL